MKKLLASLTILTILALPLGSAASAEQQTPPADLSVEEVHGNIPAQADASQAMYPAVHSLVLAMNFCGTACTICSACAARWTSGRSSPTTP